MAHAATLDHVDLEGGAQNANRRRERLETADRLSRNRRKRRIGPAAGAIT